MDPGRHVADSEVGSIRGVGLKLQRCENSLRQWRSYSALSVDGSGEEVDTTLLR